MRRALGEAIGEKVAEYVFDNQENINRELDALEKHIKIFTEKLEDRPRVGHTGVEPDAAIQEACKKHGFDIVDGKSFDMLITNDMNSTTGKMETARRKNLPIYTVAGFIAKYQ